MSALKSWAKGKAKPFAGKAVGKDDDNDDDAEADDDDDGDGNREPAVAKKGAAAVAGAPHLARPGLPPGIMKAGAGGRAIAEKKVFGSGLSADQHKDLARLHGAHARIAMAQNRPQRAAAHEHMAACHQQAQQVLAGAAPPAAAAA